MNTSIMPRVVSSRDIQRNYRKIFDEVKKNKQPVVVLTNNNPDVAIVGIEQINELYIKAQRGEMLEAKEAIDSYYKEKKAKKLKKLTSLKDLA